MKKFLIFFMCISSVSFAQNIRPYWFIFEEGKKAFRDGDYGPALIAFEEARHERRIMYERMEQELINLLSTNEVRTFNDDLNRVEQYVAERYLVNAQAALDELYYRVPKESLNGSALQALAEIGHLKDYPEAEYWVGETYRVEGELTIALKQYEKAYQQRDLLENPGFAIEILYKMVDIHRIRQEYFAMERRALEILEQDTLWSRDTNAQTRTIMMRIIDNEGINRFLTIYRYNNPSVEQAHRLLGLYYYSSGRYNLAADHLMFSFLIQNSLLAREVSYGRFDFRFTTLEALLSEAQQKPGVNSYLETVEYYKTIYYCGAAWYASGRSGSQFWRFLTNQPQAGEWEVRARNQLRSPSIEGRQAQF
ncbi:MAG: hypothetical protein LBQ77_01805 [Treponema sp.]|jgi:tetratricopeptide (TPR) repeat protein|nr:hypothetical protein [Treponema sp.]